MTLAVWSVGFVPTLNRLDENPTEANEEIPIDSTLDEGQENCSALLFLVTIHVASPFIKLHIIHSPRNFNHRIQSYKQLQVFMKLKDKNRHPNFAQELVQETKLFKIKHRCSKLLALQFSWEPSCWHVYPNYTGTHPPSMVVRQKNNPVK